MSNISSSYFFSGFFRDIFPVRIRCISLLTFIRSCLLGKKLLLGLGAADKGNIPSFHSYSKEYFKMKYF
jgi:hypothetical protein